MDRDDLNIPPASDPGHEAHAAFEDDGTDPMLPPGLLADLKGIYGRPLALAPEQHEAILELVDAELAPLRHRGAVRRWGLLAAGFGASVAASIALILWLNTPMDIRIAGDVNGDGRVDIVDALSLARRLKSGQTPPPRLDLNRDGVIDHRDVDLIAQQAVTPEGSRG